VVASATAMDAQQALADLTEISAQIEAAVIARRSGEVIASTLSEDERAKRFARAAIDLLDAARTAPGAEGGDPVQLEAALGDGHVFVVPEADRVIAAATRPEPTVGLVFYDLKSALRSSAPADEAAEPAPKAEEPAPKPKPKPRPRAKKADDTTAAEKPKPKPRARRAPRKKPEAEGDGAA
jgi:predicted regulator of Ras-like GTPase activity (Roadblock/LC7/MglB family)